MTHKELKYASKVCNEYWRKREIKEAGGNELLKYEAPNEVEQRPIAEHIYLEYVGDVDLRSEMCNFSCENSI